MPVYDLYSKRQKKLNGDVADVYVYDRFPIGLKIQIVYIWNDAIGDVNMYTEANKVYDHIVNVLLREYGLPKLPNSKNEQFSKSYDELGSYFMMVLDKNSILDVIELTFSIISNISRTKNYLDRTDNAAIADEAIAELNIRFKEHAVGYRFENNEIIRVDSEFIHAEAIKPALRLLNAPGYEGAQQEFLNAHEHYRQGKAKEAINECLKAFESLMKIICKKRKWVISGNATAKQLIETCLNKGLIPSFWQSHFTALRSLLESGVPTGRNKVSGHGQGDNTDEVPNYLVAYMLHMTASTIVFLAEADSAMK